MEASQIAEDVNADRASAAVIVDEAIRAMTALDQDLHFVMDRWHERAQRISAAVDARPVGKRGVLAGVPFLVKDGTGLGTPLVERLVAAGAVPLGTSTRPALGSTCQSWGWNGANHTRNPWHRDRSSGGSSAGSAAAVAAGVVPLATGGDSAGSLRIPASFCGVVGFKGSNGRIPRGGGRSLAQLTCAGVIGSSIANVTLAVQVASGSHPRDPTSLPPWKPESIGARIPRVAFSADLGFATPDAAISDLVRTRVETLAANGIIELVDEHVCLSNPEEAWLTLYALDRGEHVPRQQLASAVELRGQLDADLADFFQHVDILITPTTPETAFLCEDFEANMPSCHLCWTFNISGHPALTVPVGLINGLPVGAQIVAAPYADASALAVGELIKVDLPTPPIHASRGLHS